MNKWVVIPVIAILAVGLIVGGYFLWQQTDKLGESESEIVALEGNVSTLEGTVSTLQGQLADSEATVATLEGNVSTLEGEVSTLEGNVSTLEGNVSTMETNLAESEATVSTLETDLETANSEIEDLQADVSTQRSINSALSEELKTVKDPRHFSSLAELVDWLREDDTDTKYAGETVAVRCFILQVRALRDGYLLPVSFYVEGGQSYITNKAVIGDAVYYVYLNDTIEREASINPLPSHPLPLD